MQPRDADRGIDLVERAVGGDAQVVFLAPLAGAERGGAVIAGAGVDLVEHDHGPIKFGSLDMTQSVHMMTMMAMNCSSTRSRISFCEVLPEPPRIMLTRPSRSTTATAPMAIGNGDVRHEIGHGAHL